MFIRIVDEGLERLVRAELPLPKDVGDVSFEVPSSNWSAQLSRVTVNLFLFDVTRSTHPNRAPVRRVDENGKGQRRPPQPMVELSYLVSAWAGNPRDEHQLLGEVLSKVAGLDVLPDEYLSRPLSSSVQLSFVEDDRHRARDIWNGAGGSLKAGFTMHVTVAADTFGWAPEPPAVTSIEGSAQSSSGRKPQ
jgi:Pvc16 N-terminal domain